MGEGDTISKKYIFDQNLKNNKSNKDSYDHKLNTNILFVQTVEYNKPHILLLKYYF